MFHFHTSSIEQKRTTSFSSFPISSETHASHEVPCYLPAPLPPSPPPRDHSVPPYLCPLIWTHQTMLFCAPADQHNASPWLPTCKISSKYLFNLLNISITSIYSARREPRWGFGSASYFHIIVVLNTQASIACVLGLATCQSNMARQLQHQICRC